MTVAPSTTTNSCQLTVLYGDQQVKSIQVEQGQTLLEAMENSGLPADSSCRAGVCMTCAVKLLEGEVDNEEAALAAEAREAGFILACSAYPLSPQVKVEINHGELLLRPIWEPVLQTLLCIKHRNRFARNTRVLFEK